MDTFTPYRDDVYAWSREQADVLRRLKGLAGLPNALDLDNIAEEIESLGGDARRSVESFIRLVLVHLVKIAANPGSAAQAHWRIETLNFHAEVIGRYARTMRQDIDFQRLWRRAYEQAEVTLAVYGEKLPELREEACPLTLGDLLENRLDLERAVERVRATLERDERA